MTYRRQEPPNAVQIELVEGCQLRCSFCGLNGIRGKANNFKMMEEATLRTLCVEMNHLHWNPRIEFAMHGEPSFHPELLRMVSIPASVNPGWHVMMTSNGGGLLRKPGPSVIIRDLFAAGLDVLALDDYDGVKVIEKIRLDLIANGYPPGVAVREYPADPLGNPHSRRKAKMITFIQDITLASKGTHADLNNHAGAGAPKDHSKNGVRCAKPFRELSVRWDGNVAVCCNDWRGEYKCGNVVHVGLDLVWNSPAMGAARQKLYHGQRDFGPCDGCNARSYRLGLLPDKMGKDDLPSPTEFTVADIDAALRGPPYTEPVLREWERVE
jgi:MoaA/NifB/PqqE/SkfB family radical SAM enzyme